MQIRDGYDEAAVIESISTALRIFYGRLTAKIDSIEIMQLMKSKNPYLYRAKAIASASEIVDSVLNAFISSSEETIFGNVFFEPLAIAAVGGSKSLGGGIDVEVDDAKRRIKYAIAVKSGTAVFNADSRKKQEDNFSAGMKRALQANLQYVPIIGYGYGQKQNDGNAKKIYLELAGEDFWTALTGDAQFYKKIISYMGKQPEKYVEQFNESYARAKNRLVREFTNNFCSDDGGIDWDRLVEYNSASKDRIESETLQRNMQSVYSVIADDPKISKSRIGEATGLAASAVAKAISALKDAGALARDGNMWVVK